ncbi:conserved hypothetical protein [delta proteobacterium NaphS2]|nr:conserved hypothetical protein [delta proteobacterium NaphS2]
MLAFSTWNEKACTNQKIEYDSVCYLLNMRQMQMTAGHPSGTG